MDTHINSDSTRRNATAVPSFLIPWKYNMRLNCPNPRVSVEESPRSLVSNECVDVGQRRARRQDAMRVCMSKYTRTHVRQRA